MNFPNHPRYVPGASIQVRPLGFAVDCARAYRLISAGSRYSFWLDSARPESPMSRYSYLGVVPAEGRVLISDDAREPVYRELNGSGQEVGRVPGSLDRGLITYLAQGPAVNGAPGQLDEALLGGYVGYFGYEYRARTEPGSPVTHSSPTPDGAWLQAVRYMLYDHQGGQSWLVGDTAWLDAIEAALCDYAGEESTAPPTAGADAQPMSGLVFSPPTRTDYTADVRTCQQEIADGKSYEICLTAQTQASAVTPVSPEQALATYLLQRQHNPAPYAAFIHCDSFYILSSSPERFLTISPAGQVETKPIKGTIERTDDPLEDARRAYWLAHDPKTRAENLMIVDLLRNDLSRISYPESVRVPVLMGVESYQTVHQLVSTVQAQMRPQVGRVEAALACFPGGSMTGAPKPSTMDIIDRLEGRARGIYSGALGFFSATGAVNLSIVIRALVISSSGQVSLSAGGAIVADSDPDAEYEEMLAKLAAALPPQLGRLG